MTPSQIRQAKSMVGKFPRDEIAKSLGVSVSNLKRSCPGVRFCFFNKYKASPDLVKRVCKYYEKHGKTKTQKRFPDIKVRSIVERYKNFSPRQIRWTSKQIKEAAQMAGLVSLENQAKHFNRPNAHRGSIVSLWMKKFGTGGGNVNGLSWNIARHFVRRPCPVITTQVWRSRKSTGTEYSRRIVLWSDFARYQKSSNPEWIKDAAKALARFQFWLHNTKNIHNNVNKLLEEIK